MKDNIMYGWDLYLASYYTGDSEHSVSLISALITNLPHTLTHTLFPPSGAPFPLTRPFPVVPFSVPFPFCSLDFLPLERNSHFHLFLSLQPRALNALRPKNPKNKRGFYKLQVCEPTILPND